MSTTSSAPSNTLSPSQQLLEKARQDVANYSSAQVREKIVHGFHERAGSHVTPYDWQLDVAEAILLGLDCSVIAGTGAGKTLPFILPLFVESEKIVIIISPLNALEEDQAKRFNKLGLSAVAVNGETYTDKLHKEIEQKKHRVILTSPEMCLEHPRFRQLLSSVKFASSICSIVVDEAHCIAQWGTSFRPLYAQLGTLRAFVPMKVPFLVTSATLPPSVLTHVRAVLHFSTATTYHVNLGTDRPNIAWSVKLMNGAKSDLESLAMLIPANSGDDLVQSMVFFDDINLALDALRWIKAQLPEHQRDQVAVYHSRRSKLSKCLILIAFLEGKIKILLTTEAAGMGCDLPHIEQVIQFMVPESLSIWMQRAGRSGRSIDIRARAILLVQPSVFQEIKAPIKKPKAGTSKSVPLPEAVDGPNYRKNIEEGLRQWITAEGCRRNASDQYFGNVPFNRKSKYDFCRVALKKLIVHYLDPTGICCDNCLRKNEPGHPFLNIFSSLPITGEDVEPRSAPPTSDADPSTTLNTNGKRPMDAAPSAANRRDVHLQGARKLLKEWRLSTWQARYQLQPWGPQCLLPDAVLSSLALKARYCTLSVAEVTEDSGWSATHARRHCQDVLDLLKAHDEKHHAAATAEKVAKAEKKKHETIARNKAKRDLKQAEMEERRLAAIKTPKAPRPSRSKKPALGESTHLNTPQQTLPTHPPATPMSHSRAGIENRSQVPTTPLNAALHVPHHPITPIFLHSPYFTSYNPHTTPTSAPSQFTFTHYNHSTYSPYNYPQSPSTRQ